MARGCVGRCLGVGVEGRKWQHTEKGCTMRSFVGGRRGLD